MSAFLCFAVSLAGSVIQRITGFGYGIFAMIFLPHILSAYGPSTVLSTMVSASASIIVAIQMRKYINWKVVFPPVIVGVVTSYLSVKFMSGRTDDTLKLLLGVFLVLMSVYFIFFAKKVKFKPTVLKGAVAGGLSGILGGLFAMSGPPVVVYYMMTSKNMNEYLATIQMYFVLSDLTNILIKANEGFVTSQVLFLYPFALAAVFIGSALGKKIHAKCNPDLLTRGVYVFMAISGIINIITTLA